LSDAGGGIHIDSWASKYNPVSSVVRSFSVWLLCFPALDPTCSPSFLSTRFLRIESAEPTDDFAVGQLAQQHIVWFLRATAYMLSAHMLSQFRPSVRLSVRLYVCLSHG